MDHIYCGDALTVLRTLPAESVHCVMTSPPYWRLRDYGVAGQYGLEEQVDCLGWATGQPCGECFICRLVAVFGEVKRVLRRDGVVWLNMGDSYVSRSTSKHGRGKNCGGVAENPPRVKPPRGLQHKDLVGQPWRLALALQADGWILRSDVIWNKPNPMPSSAEDRPTVSHEHVFLLVRSGRYFWNYEAMQEPVAAVSHGARVQSPRSVSFDRPVAEPVRPGQTASQHRPGRQKVPSGWDTTRGAHGTIHREGRSSKIRSVRPGIDVRGGGQGNGEMQYPADTRNRRTVWTIPVSPFREAHYATFPPALVEPCLKAGCPLGGIVLDPFFGAGTTGLVARRLGRAFVGVELNPDNCRMAQRRIERDSGLFGPVEIVWTGGEAVVA